MPSCVSYCSPDGNNSASSCFHPFHVASCNVGPADRVTWDGSNLWGFQQSGTSNTLPINQSACSIRLRRNLRALTVQGSRSMAGSGCQSGATAEDKLRSQMCSRKLDANVTLYQFIASHLCVLVATAVCCCLDQAGHCCLIAVSVVEEPCVAAHDQSQYIQAPKSTHTAFGCGCWPRLECTCWNGSPVPPGGK